MEYNCEVFGTWLASRMDGLGLSQSELAARAGVTQQAVSNWIKGAARPRGERARRLAEALDVTIDELLRQIEDGEHVPPPRPAPTERRSDRLDRIEAGQEEIRRQLVELSDLIMRRLPPADGEAG